MQLLPHENMQVDFCKRVSKGCTDERLLGVQHCKRLTVQLTPVGVGVGMGVGYQIRHVMMWIQNQHM